MVTSLPPDLWDVPDDDPFRPVLNTAGLESWMRSVGLGPRVRVTDGPEIDNDPGTMIVVTWLPGAGIDLEGAIQRPAFQLRVIGPQGNRDAARELAERLDTELVLRDAWPAFVGGRYVIVVGRSGGEPALDRQDAAGRAHYVCTYVADVESH